MQEQVNGITLHALTNDYFLCRADISKPYAPDTKPIATARNADVVVLVLGNSRDQEHEGIDRADIKSPANHGALAKAVLALGKPTVLVSQHFVCVPHVGSIQHFVCVSHVGSV